MKRFNNILLVAGGEGWEKNGKEIDVNAGGRIKSTLPVFAASIDMPYTAHVILS